MIKLKGTALLLYDKLKLLIAEMAAGDCLPPIHELKVMYSVGQGTIEKALKQLEEDSIIAIKKKKGCFVLDSGSSTDSKSDTITHDDYEHFPWLNTGDLNISLELSRSAFPSKMLEHLTSEYNKQVGKCNVVLSAVDDRQFSFSQKDGVFDLRYYPVHLQIEKKESLLGLEKLMKHNPLPSELHKLSFFMDDEANSCKALALFMTTAMLAYNKNVFKNLGLNADILSSWDGFIGACANIKQKFPQKFPFICSGYMSSLPRWGFSLNSNHLEFRTGEFIDYVNFLKKMVHDEKYMPVYAESWQSYLPRAEKCLADYAVFEYYPHFNLNNKDIELMPMPLRPGGHELVSTALFGIGKNSVLPEESWEFIRFALSLEGQKIIHLYKEGTRPAIKDCSHLVPDERKLRIMDKILDSGEPAYMNSLALYEARLIIESRLEAWLKRPGDPEKLAEDIQERVSKFIANMNDYKQYRV